MAPAGIPEDVSRFIADNITSVMQLELLVLLIGSGRDWNASDLARELRIDAEHAVAQLQGLLDCGLAGRNGSSYSYAPVTPRLASDAERLASLYDTHRVAITAAIYAPRQDRGVDPVQGFSDAFRLRKEKE